MMVHNFEGRKNQKSKFLKNNRPTIASEKKKKKKKTSQHDRFCEQNLIKYIFELNSKFYI